MVWQQVYDPMGSMFLSTLFASLPVIVMLVGLGFLHMKAHIAAGLLIVRNIGCSHNFWHAMKWLVNQRS